MLEHFEHTERLRDSSPRVDTFQQWFFPSIIVTECQLTGPTNYRDSRHTRRRHGQRFANMIYRQFGRASVDVSLLGFGTWPLAATWWGRYDLRKAQKALEVALDIGVNFVDTAAAYDDGDVELKLGRILRNVRRTRPIAIASKIAPQNRLTDPSNLHARYAYPSRYVRASVEQSVRALGVDALFLCQLHTWAPRWLSEGDWLEALWQLRAAGLVRFLGVSVPDNDTSGALAAIRSGYFDAIQVRHNLFWQDADQLFGEAARNGVAVIVRSPLLEGVLVRTQWRTGMRSSDWRRMFFGGEYGAHLDTFHRQLRETLARTKLAPAEAALRYASANPAVATVLVGSKQATHVRQNAAVICRRRLSTRTMQEFRTLRAQTPI